MYRPVPPIEIYHQGHEIGDAEGHLCTAENPEIAEMIVNALNEYVERQKQSEPAR